MLDLSFITLITTIQDEVFRTDFRRVRGVCISTKITCHHHTNRYSASGLGRACVRDICANGGNSVILDMNEELGNDLVKELGASAKFFICDVADTDNIAAVVQSTVEWVKQTGKPLGGIIPAAGVGRPGLVCHVRPTGYMHPSRPIHPTILTL